MRVYQDLRFGPHASIVVGYKVSRASMYHILRISVFWTLKVVLQPQTRIARLSEQRTASLPELLSGIAACRTSAQCATSNLQIVEISINPRMWTSQPKGGDIHRTSSAHVLFGPYQGLCQGQFQVGRFKAGTFTRGLFVRAFYEAYVDVPTWSLPTSNCN